MTVLNPHVIHDVNGKRTTVYRRPESVAGLGRADSVGGVPIVAKDSYDITDYLDNKQPLLYSPRDQSDISHALKDNREGFRHVLFLSDDAFFDNEEIVIDASDVDDDVLVQLDSRAKARLVVSGGTVVIKTFGEHHTPEIVLAGETKATLIVAADTTADITTLDSAEVVVLPEVGCSGTVNPQGSQTPRVADTGNLHRIVVFAH